MLRTLKAWWRPRFILAVALLTFSFFIEINSSAPGLVWGQGNPKATDEPQIKVRVNLVNTPVVVRDASGALVTGLTQENFRLFDNGIAQTLEGVEIGGAELAVAFVVETSTRIAALLPVIRRTGLLLTQSIVGETSNAALIQYSDEANKLCDFTNDHGVIEKAIAGLQPGSSGANLYDALSAAVDLLRDTPPSRRRVIVTLAEAVDTGSEEKLAAITRRAQIADITIYAIGLSTARAEVSGPDRQAALPPFTPPGTYGLPPVPGSAYTTGDEQLRSGNMDLGALVRHTWSFVARQPSIQAAVSATGGLFQSTYDDESIERSIDQISAELYTQYVLSFQSNTHETKGGFHDIKVVVVRQPESYKVRYRPVYYMNFPKE
jgi:VWFA-related protein